MRNSRFRRGGLARGGMQVHTRARPLPHEHAIAVHRIAKAVAHKVIGGGRSAAGFRSRPRRSRFGGSRQFS